LKANILLEYAWFSDLRILCTPFEDQFVLVWKIKQDEGDSGGDDLEEHIENVKKHTEVSLDPVKNNVEEINEIIKILQHKVSLITDKLGIKDKDE